MGSAAQRLDLRHRQSSGVLRRCREFARCIVSCRIGEAIGSHRRNDAPVSVVNRQAGTVAIARGQIRLQHCNGGRGGQGFGLV